MAVSPDGIQYEFLGLSEFCREHGLEHSCMTRVALGTRKQYKGWRCWKKDTGPVAYAGVDKNNLSRAARERQAAAKIRGPKTYVVLDPGGQEIALTNRECKRLGLDVSAITRVSRGLGRSHKGYTSPRAS